MTAITVRAWALCLDWKGDSSSFGLAIFTGKVCGQSFVDGFVEHDDVGLAVFFTLCWRTL